MTSTDPSAEPRRLRRRVATPVAAALAAVAIGVGAGCGGGGSSSSTTSSGAGTTSGAATSGTSGTSTTGTGTSTTGKSTSGTSTTGTATTSGSVQTFTSDGREASAALSSFAATLASASLSGDLKAKANDLQADLDRWSQAVKSMRGYTLSQSNLEQARTAIVQKAPGVRQSLEKVVQAARSGERTQVIRQLPEVRRQVQSLASALAAAR